MERRKILTSLGCFLTAGGLFGYEFATSPAQGGDEENGSTPQAKKTETPSRQLSSSVNEVPEEKEREKSIDPEKTTVLIDDLEGISVGSDTVEVDVLIGIENQNELPLQDVSGSVTASVDSFDVASTEFSIETVDGKGDANKHISFVFALEDVQDSIIVSILAEEFELGLSGYFTGDGFDRKEFSESVTVDD